MSAAKIRKGDTVVVLSGKDKGKTGEVIRSIPKDSKVVVAGVNIAVRHRKVDVVDRGHASPGLGHVLESDRGHRGSDPAVSL